jgi:hypothetical protein
MPQLQLQNLTTVLQDWGQAREIPPLHLWQPQSCGEMDLLIKANGEWWHEGQPIQRQAMIDLFAKVLWKEGQDYYLKTPSEKIKIQVEDAPLLVNQVEQIESQGIVYIQMQTQNQDVFVLDAQHPLVLRDYQGELRPYVRVRYDLDALIARSTFYHLVNLGELFIQDQHTILQLQSAQLCMQLQMA